MKDKFNIPIPKAEDLAALNKRRENYAATRDQQASEFNLAITKRLEEEAMHLIKCSKCGKEFAAGEGVDSPLTCTECANKSEQES